MSMASFNRQGRSRGEDMMSVSQGGATLSVFSKRRGDKIVGTCFNQLIILGRKS